MAQIVSADTIEQASVTSDKNGVTIVRRYLIDGVTGSGSSKLLNALQCPGLPRYGQVHPDISANVSSVVPRPASDGSTTQCEVIVTYNSPQSELLNQTPDEAGEVAQSWGSTLVQIETSHPPSGPDWVLNHTTAAGKILEPQPFKATVQEPVITFMATRPEPISFSRQKIILNEGRLNQGTWNLLAEGHWLCSAIKSELKGGYVQMRYEFLGRIYRDWQPIGVYTDPVTKAPFKEIVGGVVKVAPEVSFPYYGYMNFGALALGV